MTSKQRGIILVLAVAAAIVAAGLYLRYRPVTYKEVTFTGTGNMRIQSPDFEQGGPIPARFTCDGENVSPGLSISGVPEAAVSLALIMDDPDAPMGTWVHWTVWNLPPDITEIASPSALSGVVEGVTSFGKPGYGGPCPPSGTHRYFFKLYALDDKLDLPPDTPADELEAAMNGHVLDKAGLFGVYGR